MSTAELDALIVSNLADLDATVKHLSRIELTVLATMDEIASSWASENSWNSECNYESSNMWLAPPSWRNFDKEGDLYPRFYASTGAGDTEAFEEDEDYYYLTRLCGCGVGQLGFVFWPRMITPAKFKRMLKDVAPLLKGTGFAFDDDNRVFLPFKLDIVALSAAIKEEAIEDAFGPFRAALGQLKSAQPAFDKIIEMIKKTEVTA